MHLEAGCVQINPQNTLQKWYEVLGVLIDGGFVFAKQRYICRLLDRNKYVVDQNAKCTIWLKDLVY